MIVLADIMCVDRPDGELPVALIVVADIMSVDRPHGELAACCSALVIIGGRYHDLECVSFKLLLSLQINCAFADAGVYFVGRISLLRLRMNRGVLL